MTQEGDQHDLSDHPPTVKLDEVGFHDHPRSEESSVKHDSSLNQADAALILDPHSSSDDEDEDEADEMELSSPKPQGTDSPDDDDKHGEDETSDEDTDSSDTDDEDEDHEDSDDERDDNYYYDRPQIHDSFERDYTCFPLSLVDKSHLQTGNKIIMPVEALMPLMETKISMPMQFEIHNKSTGKVSHCGVFEFTGEDPLKVFLPEWMMKNMQLQEGDQMIIKNKNLEKGTYIKLQPHSVDFLGISNPKAMLEENLQNFSCLTMGDTIMVSHGGKNFYIDIVETQPSSAINIIDVDCVVDFEPPLDYKEPEKCAAEESSENEKPKFKPFTGLARRLDGKLITSTELDSVSVPNKIEKEESAETVSEMFNRRLAIAKEKSSVESETSKNEPKFQPFTGKKYTLAD